MGGTFELSLTPQALLKEYVTSARYVHGLIAVLYHEHSMYVPSRVQALCTHFFAPKYCRSVFCMYKYFYMYTNLLILLAP